MAASLQLDSLTLGTKVYRMNSPAKILLIDNEADRKERIRALKNRGYAVFPALKMEDAHSRCLRGNYDLIVVAAGGEQERATEFCDEIRRQRPLQHVLMTAGSNGGREYAVGSDLQSLVEAVDRILRSSGDYANAA